MLLSEYITQTQLVIHDSSYQTVTQPDMVSYINRARRRIAQDAQCVRTLIAGEGPILSVTVVGGGINYTNPTITVTGGMGTGAVLTPTVVGGVITAVTVTNGGSNYAPPLQITIVDATGANASLTPVQGPLLQCTVGQEVYTYAAANAFLPAGYLQILDVLNLAVQWGGMKPAIGQIPWNTIQAYYRSYAVPTLGQVYKWAKYGQGVMGSIYLWQIPSTAQSMDWDCVCLPIDLVDDTTVDTIPAPFDDAVQYYAARLCYLNAQRYSDADMMKEEYKSRAVEARTVTSAPMIDNWYDNSW